MPADLLICTDLDRTLIPNGSAPESAGARQRFATLVGRPGVVLAYVSGRDRNLLEQAIDEFSLPVPDYAIGDVGTTIYRVGSSHAWQRDTIWAEEIGRDWADSSHDDLAGALADLTPLRLQEPGKQNEFKLSYYVATDADRAGLRAEIKRRLETLGIRYRLIWSVDEVTDTGLLDVLPERASKLHAIEALMRELGCGAGQTVFCGDSGNDLEVLASAVPAVLVANASDAVRAEAQGLADAAGHADRLYCAHGGFHGMNGNYAGGMLEGIEYYHPGTYARANLTQDMADR